MIKDLAHKKSRDRCKYLLDRCVALNRQKVSVFHHNQALREDGALRYPGAFAKGISSTTGDGGSACWCSQELCAIGECACLLA
jgi:hypothetical protein